MVLTKAGHLFLEHANKIIADCDVAVDKMQELSSNGGEIDIGYVFPLASNMKRGTASVWCCSFFDTQVCNKSCRWQVLLHTWVWENVPAAGSYCENSKLYHFKGKQYLN